MIFTPNKFGSIANVASHLLLSLGLLVYICPEYRKMIYHYNKTPIFYNIAGEGPVLVLLHGFLESSNMWSKLVPTLSKNRKILTIDLPGHGKSECIAPIHSMEDMANVVYALLNHLQIEKASIMGHSMGGYVALALLEAHEHILEEFTLLNSTTRADTCEQKRNRDRGARIVSENKKAFIGNIINLLFVQSSHQQYTSEIATLKKEAMNFPIEGILAAIQGMKNRPDRTKVLKNFNRNKIIICGDDDPVVPFSISKEISKVTDSKLITLLGGHMSWIENTEELLKLYT